MRHVKVFEAWTEEKEEEFSHKEIYEILEELVDAWKAWKENEDEEKDEEELHDEFMTKVEGIIEKAKEIVEEEEEEEEETETEEEETETEEEETETEEEETETEEEEVEEVEEGRVDLSQKQGSLSNLLEPLISSMGTMDFDELKSEFINILRSPFLKASQATRSKWIQKATEIRSKAHLMSTISNIYLRGSGLGANPKDYNA